MSVNPTAWRNAVITETLGIAVPLRIHELAQLAPDARERLRASIDPHDLHADDAMFGGTHAAEGVRNIITTLALLAHAEGGVDFAGLHFCTDHTNCIKTGWKAS